MKLKPPPDTAGEAEPLVLEQDERLSRSIIWRYGRQFFERWGVAAWGDGHVPQYVTCNPRIARAYASVFLGWLHDCRTALVANEPVYLLELGAGSGRFAFQLLNWLIPAWRRSSLRDVPICYVMSDFSERVVAHWREHPALACFVEAGVLEFATFDPVEEQELRLHRSRRRLAPGAVANPLAAVGNYLFDLLPHDAFAVRSGRLHERRLTTACEPPIPDPGSPELFRKLKLTFEERPVDGEGPYPGGEPAWNNVLRSYEQRLDDTVILFPEGGLRCLDNLRRLSGGRLLMITADRGQAHEWELIGQDAPNLGLHGCFTLPVNYHAVAEVVASQGGLAFRPRQPHQSIVIAAFVAGANQHDWGETRLAFDEAIANDSPDDFFALKQALDAVNYEVLKIEQILAFLRLSGYDPDILARASETLINRLPDAHESAKVELVRILREAWARYYHIGEQQDLPFRLGQLLVAASYHREALEFFGHSLQLYNEHATTYANMALCHYRMSNLDSAYQFIEHALNVDPSSSAARSLRVRFDAEQSALGSSANGPHE